MNMIMTPLARAKLLFLVFVITVLPLSCRKHDFLAHRWVRVSRTLQSDRHVAEIRDIVEQASQNGLNGMVLSANLDQLDLQPPAYFKRLAQVKEICAANGVEIIPIIFSAGYGSAVLFRNKNLAAAFPVRDLPYTVRNGKAYLQRDAGIHVANGGFEQASGNRVEGSMVHELPGQISFVDAKTKWRGKNSLRFENFSEHPNGNARLIQQIEVKPNRNYRISFLTKTNGLKPIGGFRTQIYGENQQILMVRDNEIPSTSGWKQLAVAFNSLNHDKVNLYIGIWGGKEGKFWLDEVRIEEIGLANVLRRPGTSVVVKNARTLDEYEEGKDYESIADPHLSFSSAHDGPPIRILPGGRIGNGDQLLVSYYHGIAFRGQVSVCMSEPELYDIWRQRAKLIAEHLPSNKIFLSMDEIRQGGMCQACKQRGISMAEILGECITKQTEIIRSMWPHAEIFVWSDMLDPNHNAHDNYYLVEGDFAGSWQHVPGDITVVCWSHRIREESLAHFSSLGFKTLAGAYYDGSSLDNPRDWLKVLERTKGATGIMYTTWQNKYELLIPFAKLLSERPREENEE